MHRFTWMAKKSSMYSWTSQVPQMYTHSRAQLNSIQRSNEKTVPERLM